MSAPVPNPAASGFTPEQKQYLEGFLSALAVQAPFVGQTASGRLTASPTEAPANLAQVPAEATVFGTPLADLCKPERWKYDENPLDIWEKLVAHADADKFPDEADTFRFKFHGLFHVAPTQDSFMLRLRLPAGEISAAQLAGLADIADWGGGYAHITTRANLQIRELRPRDIIRVLVRLQELGLTSRGAGADNIRNITASPNSGCDPDELIDVRPFARALHHYILNHRDLFGLPRKFNVAFDNGGSLSTAADTNDIAFTACRVTEKSLSTVGGALRPDGRPESRDKPAPTVSIEPGVYFRCELGGISGHGDFARDTGLLLKPSECVAVAAAMIRVFNEHGDRTNRKKARLKYLLEKWGVEKFVAEAQARLAFTLVHLPLAACEPRKPHFKHGWLGVHRQPQRGSNYVGAGTPVGRMTSRQMRRVAELVTNYARGELRLTVWQSFLVPHVPDAFTESLRRSLERAGFPTQASLATGGIIACTGNKGCKYSAADTKGHALALMKHLGDRVELDAPVNIHFTGCPHSCAQHYCGDIGLVGSKLTDGSEGYHVVLGGGMGHEQGIAREIFRGVNATEVPHLTEQILRTYQAKKLSGESFVDWSRRHSVKELQELLSS